MVVELRRGKQRFSNLQSRVARLRLPRRGRAVVIRRRWTVFLLHMQGLWEDGEEQREGGGKTVKGSSFFPIVRRLGGSTWGRHSSVSPPNQEGGKARQRCFFQGSKSAGDGGQQCMHAQQGRWLLSSRDSAARWRGLFTVCRRELNNTLKKISKAFYQATTLQKFSSLCFYLQKKKKNSYFAHSCVFTG